MADTWKVASQRKSFGFRVGFGLLMRSLVKQEPKAGSKVRESTTRSPCDMISACETACRPNRQALKPRVLAR